MFGDRGDDVGEVVVGLFLVAGDGDGEDVEDGLGVDGGLHRLPPPVVVVTQEGSLTTRVWCQIAKTKSIGMCGMGFRGTSGWLVPGVIGRTVCRTIGNVWRRWVGVIRGWACRICRGSPDTSMGGPPLGSGRTPWGRGCRGAGGRSPRARS